MDLANQPVAPNYHTYFPLPHLCFITTLWHVWSPRASASVGGVYWCRIWVWISSAGEIDGALVYSYVWRANPRLEGTCCQGSRQAFSSIPPMATREAVYGVRWSCSPPGNRVKLMNCREINERLTVSLLARWNHTLVDASWRLTRNVIFFSDFVFCFDHVSIGRLNVRKRIFCLISHGFGYIKPIFFFQLVFI